jgi:hypothetical protein
VVAVLDDVPVRRVEPEREEGAVARRAALLVAVAAEDDVDGVLVEAAARAAATQHRLVVAVVTRRAPFSLDAALYAAVERLGARRRAELSRAVLRACRRRGVDDVRIVEVRLRWTPIALGREQRLLRRFTELARRLDADLHPLPPSVAALDGAVR